MKLWLISQTFNIDYDTYDSAVVAAETEAIAREMAPSGDPNWNFGWAKPEHVNVKYLGEAEDGTKEGVICASFNAG